MLTREWDKYLDLYRDGHKDVFYREEYVQAHAGSDDQAICFVLREDVKCFLCPFLMRQVNPLEGRFFDVETAYGYAGPLVNTDDQGFIQRAQALMFEELNNSGVIAGFIRFNPFLQNQEIMRGSPLTNVFFQRKSVIMDLRAGEDQIWQDQVDSVNRRAIRKAQNAGLRFVVDREGRYLERFIDMYYQTMERLEAQEFYFFDRHYFKRMGALPLVRMGVVLQENHCVSAAMFLMEGPYAHYHLAASDAAEQAFRPNNLLIYQAALYFKQQGVQWLHLGGGAEGPKGDSLLQFKLRFSPHTRDAYIGKFILNAAAYGDACRQWEQRYPEKVERYKHYLLKYRY